MRSESLQRALIDVVVPAHNCGDTLGAVLAGLPSRRVRAVVVVDNASTDSTAQVAGDAGAVVLRESRIGYGAACRRALTHLESLPGPPDIVVFMAGDGTDEPAELPALVEPVVEDNAELVLGVRGRAEDRSAARTRVALGLIGVLYRRRFEDVGPFRAIRFPALIALGMRDSGDGWNVEMQIKAVKLGLRIAEVPVSHRDPVGKGGSPLAKAKRSIGRTGRMLFQILRHSTAR